LGYPEGEDKLFGLAMTSLHSLGFSKAINLPAVLGDFNKNL